MRKIVAWLTGGTPVILEDFEGEIYYTIAYKSPFGKTYAHVYWGTKTGVVVLNDDGTVDRRYIERWVRG